MNKKVAWIGAGAVVLIGGAWLFAGGDEEGTAKEGSYAEVKRGPMSITITGNGTLKAKNSEQIRSETRRGGKISFLAEEGKIVKEGDLLVEMDKTEVTKELEQLDMNKIQYESELAAAKTELDIQKGDNESNIEKAKLKLEKAELELEKYEQGDGPQEERKLILAVEKADSEEKRAKEKYDTMPDLLKEDFVTKNQVEEERIKYEEAKIKHESSKLDLALFKKYKFPMTLKEKKVAVTDAKRDFERAKKKADSMLKQKEARVQRSERQLNRAVDRLNERKEDLEKMTIKAPKPGLVVYGDPDQPWRREEIKVGNNIWRNQLIMTLPDLAIMQVNVGIHESNITKIKEKQTVTITCDTFPGKIFHGVVTKVAELAQSGGRWWMDNSSKKFTVEVTLEGEDHGLKPGGSAKSEILVETVEDAIYVPIQAVFVLAGKHVCFVKTSGELEKREVTLGKNNENFIAITKGLEEGEEVALFNPDIKEDEEEPKKPEAAKKDKDTKSKSPKGKGDRSKSKGGKKPEVKMEANGKKTAPEAKVPTGNKTKPASTKKDKAVIDAHGKSDSTTEGQ